MALSDVEIRNAKPKKDKSYKIFDEHGLFLAVPASGAKLWRFRYKLAGKEKVLALGQYPTVSLKEARAKRDDARRLLSDGSDPSMEKKRKAAAALIAATNSFKTVADEFVDKLEQEGLAAVTVAKQRWLISLLDRAVGDRPVSEVEPVELLSVLKNIEKQGRHETAKRARALASRVFKYAIITSRAKFNPAADLGMALVAKKPKHYAALVDPEAVGGLLRAIDEYTGHLPTRLALQLLPHVFVRPGELRHAEWSEIDFEKAIWRIPAGKMKMRNEHVVPLSRQSLAILEKAQQSHVNGPYVFPAIQSWQRPMSENTLNTALRRLGYTMDEMTSHGFRSTASTLLNESGLWSADAIERSLAHKDANAVRGIYHRGAHWKERIEMAQWWSDYLDMLKAKVS